MQSLDRARNLLTRRRFLAGAAVTAATLSLYSAELERHSLTTVRRTIHITNLPDAFHGFTIAQLSDFHFRDFDEPYFIEHAVNEVNRLAPNMVALTGDFITAHRVPGAALQAAAEDSYECASILAGIKCPLRFCSLGNHDALNGPAVLRSLRAHGLTALYNQFVAVDYKGDRIWVAGIADAYFDVPNLKQALPRRKANEPLILLGHEPDFSETVAADQPVDLMLAGHTHGGQIRLPLLPAMFVPAMGIKYVSGLYNVRGNMQLYVNRGLGTMHVPFRLNCPPELTLLTLQPA